jgi:hypothetical protein
MKSCKALLGCITSKPDFEPFPIPVEKISLYTLGMNVYVTGMDIGGEGEGPHCSSGLFMQMKG